MGWLAHPCCVNKSWSSLELVEPRVPIGKRKISQRLCFNLSGRICLGPGVWGWSRLAWKITILLPSRDSGPCLSANQAACLPPGPSKAARLDSLTFFLTPFHGCCWSERHPYFAVAFEGIFISFEILGQQLFAVNIFFLHHKIFCRLPTFVASAKKFCAKWMSVLLIVCLSVFGVLGFMIMCMEIKAITCWFMSPLISWRCVPVISSL